MTMSWNVSDDFVVSSDSMSIMSKEEYKREKTNVPFPFGRCRICHDNATGVHYGVITCEGCKGFFKRTITQGIPLSCVFADQCVINIETRNRCKACRFRRCVERGMSMDCVKMGRIPKKVKEQALRERRRYSDDNGSLSNRKSDSRSANENSRQQTVNISSDGLSSLCLPSVFYYSNNENFSSASNEENCNDSNLFTVSKYISTINENILVDYLFSWELRYSNNVLKIMKSLQTKLSQPYFLYELDFQLTSFFRYIRWKMFNLYLKRTIRIQRLIERMFGVLQLGILDYPGLNATYEQMWRGVQAGISTNVKELLHFIEDTPGLNELNPVDLKTILNHRLFDFWIILHYPLFYQNESYLMTIDGLQYTRYFMNQFIGQTMTDALHQLSTDLQLLNITQVEHSLVIPIVLCRVDRQFIERETIHVIKQCYMYALYIQLTSTRTEDEAKLFFEKILQMIDRIAQLDELYRKSIGNLQVNVSVVQ